MWAGVQAWHPDSPSRVRGQPTFIHVDKPYRHQIFTSVIWVSDRPKFSNPQQEYSGKNLWVAGAVSSYRGLPEIIAPSTGSRKHSPTHAALWGCKTA